MSIIVTIEGVDRSTSVDFGSLKKTDNLNQQVDLLTFTLKKYGSLTYVPVLGNEVVVTKGGDTIFGGVIMRISETLAAAKVLEYEIECSDYSQFLKRELVTERYENMTVAAIIADLITNYTSDGFTYANSVSTQVIESISFNRLSVADCLQKLADAISYVWYVDYDKDVHFFARNSESAPFNLTDTSGNYIYQSLEIMEDATQVRNTILVQGGEAESDLPRTEYFTGDGTRDQFALANKFASLPTIEVGGVAQTVGIEFLNDDASFDVMWNFNQKYIRFTAGNVPGAGANNIEVSGIYLFPIVVRVPAPASIAEFGEYQFAITDKTINSQEEAIDRALAELESYQNELHEGSFRTYTDGLRSGQIINITSTQRSKNIDVLIQSVSAIMIDPLGARMIYSIRFATLKSIGIIAYLQNQLRSKEVIIDDEETLLNLIITADDEITSTDALGAVVTSVPPYLYAGAGGNEGEYGFATYV